MGTIRRTLQRIDARATHWMITMERRKSENWWKALPVGLLMALAALGVLGFVRGSGVFVSIGRYASVLLLAAAWGLLIASLFFDVKYVETHSDWRPSVALYIGVVLFLPIIGFVAVLAYLLQRHRHLGVP